MGDYELYHADRRKHKYIKKIGKRYFYTQQEIQAYLKEKKGDATFEKSTYDTKDGQMKDYRIDFNKHEHWSDGVGVRVGKRKVQLYNTTNEKYWNDNEVHTAKKLGPLTADYSEDGATYTLDISRRKKRGKKLSLKNMDKDLKTFKSESTKGKKALVRLFPKTSTVTTISSGNITKSWQTDSSGNVTPVKKKKSRISSVTTIGSGNNATTTRTYSDGTTEPVKKKKSRIRSSEKTRHYEISNWASKG